MTREEAKRMRYGYEPFTYEDVDVIVDVIYDDFESRTCRNCKYYKEREEKDGYGVIKSKHTYCDLEWKLNDMGDDFGCNKWESKNESKN